MEKRFTQPADVLDEQGRPNPGWASSGILKYNRKSISAPFFRVKEWDWYQVNNNSVALQFTFGHASYAGQVGVMMFDFEKGNMIYNKDIILALPFGSQGLGTSAEQDGRLVYDKPKMKMVIEKQGSIRRISCQCEGFEADVEMQQHNPNSLVINVPFKENPKAFYYNQKVNCMEARGKALVMGKEYVFGQDAWGLLDWGRGVWPFHNEWYWSSASGRIDGEMFGFNLGCGFGDTSAATENALFYKNDIHKLGKVSFELGRNYDDPWHLKDKQGRLDIMLKPMYDRETKIKLLWVNNNCHQMFGRFSGKAVLDNGQELELRDIVGFAEHAVNNW